MRSEQAKQHDVAINESNRDDNFINQYIKDDHLRMDGLFEELMESIKKHDEFTFQQSRFYMYKSSLLRHMHWEENILYPMFESFIADNDYLDPSFMESLKILKDEHIEIHTSLEFISKKLDDDIDQEKLVVLGLLVEEHNEKEERILYPLLQEFIKESDHDKMAMEHSHGFQ